MWKILKDFKEVMCPSTEINDIKNKMKLAFDETLKVKDNEIDDLKSQIEELKKKYECCWCKKTTNLVPFCEKLWKLRGYPSYYYCNDMLCMENYISQLEDI